MKIPICAIIGTALVTLGLLTGCGTSAHRAGATSGESSSFSEKEIESGLTRFRSTEGSWLKMEGTTAVHNWQARTSELSGFMEVTPNFLNEKEAGASTQEIRAHAQMSLSVRSLKSLDLNGKPFSDKFDAAIHSALAADAHPAIVYRLTELIRLRPVDPEATNQFVARGELSLAGVTNFVSIIVKMMEVDGGKLKVTGNTEVKMSAFHVKPPLPDFAVPLKYDDEVRISFEWLLQKGENRQTGRLGITASAFVSLTN